MRLRPAPKCVRSRASAGRCSTCPRVQGTRRLDSVLKYEKQKDQVDFAPAEQAWKDLQATGAADGYEQVFAGSSKHCAGFFSATGPGGDGARVTISLAFKFRDGGGAAGLYQRGLYRTRYVGSPA